MTSPAHEQLLAVQDLDLSLLQNRHKFANHPLRTEITNSEASIAERQGVADEIGERRRILEDQQNKLDLEVAAIESKRSEIDGKLYDGSVTATKDLLALQDEAKMLKDRQIGIEDDELEIMEQVEEVEAELKPIDDEIRLQVGQKAEFEASLEQALAEIDTEVARLDTERLVAAESVPTDLLRTYEGLRDDLGGVAVARLVGSTCDGCHMALSAVSFDRIKKQPEDAVVSCDQCGRILIR